MSKKISTKSLLLDKAMQIANEVGYRGVTRDEIAKRAKVAQGSVNNHLGTIAQIRKMIVRRAVKEGNAAIIAEACVYGEPYVQRHLSREERMRYLSEVA